MGDVLIVDDDECTCRVLVRLFRAAGHGASCAAGGQAALAYLAGVSAAPAGPPALVVLDWMMPDVGGADVLRRLGLDPALSGVPVLVYTALGDAATAGEARSLGAQGVVIKAGGWPDLYARAAPFLQ